MPVPIAKPLNCSSTTSPVSACKHQEYHGRRSGSPGPTGSAASACAPPARRCRGRRCRSRCSPQPRITKAPTKNSTRCHGMGIRRLGDRGKARRPPARQQQQPGADRPVEAGEPQIRAKGSGRETIDPIAGRIGDATRRLAHRASGLPLSESSVPRPVRVLSLLATGGLNASLKVGAAGRAGFAGAAAAVQACLR